MQTLDIANHFVKSGDKSTGYLHVLVTLCGT